MDIDVYSRYVYEDRSNPVLIETVLLHFMCRNTLVLFFDCLTPFQNCSALLHLTCFSYSHFPCVQSTHLSPGGGLDELRMKQRAELSASTCNVRLLWVLVTC